MKDNIAQFEQLAEYVNKIGYFEADEISSNIFRSDLNLLEDSPMKLILLAGKGKSFMLEGDFIRAKKCFDLANSIGIENLKRFSGDALAFLEYEQSLFYGMLENAELSSLYLKKAKVLAKSENLKLLIKFRETLLLAKKGKGDLENLAALVKEFKKQQIYYMYGIGLSWLNIICREQGHIDKAKYYIEKTQETAEKYQIHYLYDISQNSMGYWYILNKNDDKAMEYLIPLIENATSNYIKVIALENISNIYLAKKDYNQAIDYNLKAINVAEANGVLSQLPEDYLVMAKWYDTYFNKTEQALHYFKLGYESAVNQVEHGLGLFGPRKQAISEYVHYMQKLNYKKFENNVFENPFDFAIGKKWEEIKYTFQYHLISYHVNLTNSVEIIIDRLGFEGKATYYSIQRRLKKKGYDIPGIKKTSKEIQAKKFVPQLNLYIANNLRPLTWKDANRKFEKDVIRYLYQHYGFTKNNLSKKINLSMSAIRTKMVEQNKLNPNFVRV